MRTALLALSLAACSVPATERNVAPEVAAVEAFRAARKAGDVERARSMLGEDPRIWFDAREGAGRPWNPGGGGGLWTAWDEHFRGVNEIGGPWTVEGNAVWADMYETNDYFALTESAGSWWRATYFLGADGRISGFMVSRAEGRTSDRGRRDEFEAWARAERPEEAEYLMPGGDIDPTGDRAPRMRALLSEWRAAVGLPPIR